MPNFFGEFVEELLSWSPGELRIVLEVVAVYSVHELQVVHVVHQERLERREMEAGDAVRIGEEARVDNDIGIAVYQHTPGGEKHGKMDY